MGGRWAVAVTLVALAHAGCRDRSPAPVQRDGGPPRRVIDPPGTVRPLPPYAISNTGVGPYQLGASLANVLYELPSGPRMVLLDVPGLIKQNVIRAEDDGVLVSGAVLGDASVIAVVSKKVARTESGIAVGSQRAEFERELMPAAEGSEASGSRDATIARDPRLLVPWRLPSARLVMQDDQVVAVVLMSDGEVAPAAPEAGAEGSAGVRAPVDDPRKGKSGQGPSTGKMAGAKPLPVKGAAKGAVKGTKDPKAIGARCPPPKLSEGESGAWFGTCLSSAGEIVRIHDEEISVHSGADGKERVLTQLRTRGLVFAAPLRNAERPEERDELVVVTRNARPEDRTWTVAIYHLEAGRLVRVGENVVYRLTAEGARWIGVSLEEVEVYLELTLRDDNVAVGGFLVTKVAGRIRDVVSLREAAVGRRRGGAVDPEDGAATTVPAIDAPVDAAPDAGL